MFLVDAVHVLHRQTQQCPVLSTQHYIQTALDETPAYIPNIQVARTSLYILVSKLQLCNLFREIQLSN